MRYVHTLGISISVGSEPHIGDPHQDDRLEDVFMKRDLSRRSAYPALFAALVFIGTQFIQIPLPFGYFNLGDCFILLSAMILGSPYAVCASALGAVLADLLSGYVIYAPATVIIKALMAALMTMAAKFSANKPLKLKIVFLTIGAVITEWIMVCGYLIYDSLLYGYAGAILSLTGNIVQGGAAVVSSILIMTVLECSGLQKRFKR